MRLPHALALAALAAPSCAGAEEIASGVPEGLTLGYACAGGARVQAAYINTRSGESYAVIAHQGRLTPMKAGPTGSGVRFLSLEDPKLVWHIKGAAGFLAHDDAEQTIIAADCVAEAR